jgi:hypothetical protein
MRRVERLFIALALLGVSAPGAAQLGVEDEGADGAFASPRGSTVRVSQHARGQLIPERYTVRRGDTLWDVTGRFYGNPWEWPRVWSYNPEITNPHWIYPLDQLRLLPPGTTPAGIDAPSPIARQRRRMPEGTVFLRQEGYLDREAIAQAGVIVGSPEDHMLLSPYDSVYVEFEEGIQAAPRGEYTIFREIPSGERDAGEEGSLVRIYGTVRIDTYDAERRTARATIVEALDPIERGYRVAPMPRQLDLVPPQAADRDLETRVSATVRPRQLIGDQQVVFVPVGREEGVQLGNRFFIVHAGDQWRDELPASPGAVGATEESPPQPEEYPAEIVAEGRVVHVRPHSATLLITRAVREVRIGDRAEMRQGY